VLFSHEEQLNTGKKITAEGVWIMSESKAEEIVIDLKGISCPMPMLKTKKALQNAAVGNILRIEITDPGSKSDMPALLKRSGDELLDSREEGGVYTFVVKKR
jgi:tRNA 2-thiouridine synthesizing protein A